MMLRLLRAGVLRWTSLACLALVGHTGCNSSDQTPVYPVSGQVFVGSQPAAGANLIFRPVDTSDPEQWPSGYPRAVVQPDGSFEVTTFEPGDGAPQGRYVVLAEWKPPAAEGADPEEAAPDRLGGRYLDPDKSKLKVEVKAEPNELPRFDLE